MNPPTAGTPTREQVQLGNRVIELDPEQANAVRAAYQDLAGSYGQALDEQRRQILGSLGTPGWQPPAAAPQFEPPPSIEVPDADLLFSNKDAWQEALNQSIERRVRTAQAEQAALVQGALGAVDQELKRREYKQQAQTLHDEIMEEMLDRRNLGEHRRIVQTIYNEQYNNMLNLPLSIAIDQIGQIAEQEIAQIRGETAPATAEPTPAQTTPPALLRSSRRAGGTVAAPAPAQKTLTDLIRHRQAILLGRSEAA
jgi:hypothetical protein